MSNEMSEDMIFQAIAHIVHACVILWVRDQNLSLKALIYQSQVQMTRKSERDGENWANYAYLVQSYLIDN